MQKKTRHEIAGRALTPLRSGSPPGVTQGPGGRGGSV